MKNLLKPAIVLFLLLTVITGVVYPAAVTLIAQLVFSSQADGSLIVKDGKTVGSELIGQPVDDPKYSWGRPSVTTPAYNAASPQVRITDQPIPRSWTLSKAGWHRFANTIRAATCRSNS